MGIIRIGRAGLEVFKVRRGQEYHLADGGDKSDDERQNGLAEERRDDKHAPTADAILANQKTVPSVGRLLVGSSQRCVLAGKTVSLELLRELPILGVGGVESPFGTSDVPDGGNIDHCRPGPVCHAAPI